jgi:hypothetical protein
MAPRKPPKKKEGGIDLKSDSARISGSQLVGRDHIVGLSGKEINRIIETLLKNFPKSLLQNPDELDNTLSDFRRYHQQLHEYKELHNGINDILVAFEPFKAEVNRSDVMGFVEKPGNLRIYWEPVSLHVSSLLTWSQTIQYIGKPFQEFEDKSRSGEAWAIQFCELRNGIDDHLGLNQYSTERNNYLARFMSDFRRRKYEIPWLATLVELTGRFSNASSLFMNSADKQLRQTAQELFNLSSKALIGYQMR